MSGNRTGPEAGKFGEFWRPLLLGAGVSCAVCAALLLLLAGLMTWRDVPQQFIDPLAIAASVLGVFCGAYLCARRTHEKGMLLGMLLGGGLFLILFLLSLPVEGAAFSPILPVKLLSLLLAGAVGGILGVNRRVKHR